MSPLSLKILPSLSIIFNRICPIFDLKKNDRNDSIFSDVAIDKYQALKDFDLKKFWNGDPGLKKEVPSAYDPEVLEDTVRQINEITTAEEKRAKAEELLHSAADVEVLEKQTKGFTEQITSLDDLSDAYKYAAKDAEAFNNSFVVKGFKNVAGNFLKTIGSSLLNIGASFVVSAVIKGGIALIDYLHESEEEIIERGQKAQDNITKAQEAYSSKKDLIDSSAEKYGKLSEGVDRETNRNINLTSEEYDEFLETGNQLAELFPQLVIGYDSQGNALLDLSSNADKTTSSLKELLEQERQLASFTAAENVQDAFEGVMTQINQIKETIENSQETIEELNLIKEELSNGESFDTKISYNGSTAQLSLPALEDINDSEIESRLRKRGALINALQAQGLDLAWESSDPTNYSWTGVIENVTQEQLDALSDTYQTYLAQGMNDIGGTLSEEILSTGIDEKEVRALWNSVIDPLTMSLSVYDGYDEFNDEIKQAISKGIGSIDPLTEWINENGTIDMPKNVRAYVREKFLDPITELSTEGQEAVGNLFTFDTPDMPVEDYMSQLDSLMSSVYKYFEQTYGTDASRVFNDFQVAFGFKVVDENGEAIDSTQQMINEILAVAGMKGEDTAALSSELDTLTLTQLADLHLEVTDLSFGDEVSKAVKEAKEKVYAEAKTEPISFSSLFFEEGESSQFSKDVDTFQSDINTILTAIESLSNGETVDFTDLVQQFPELTGKAEDLKGSLSDLTVDKLSQFAADYKAAIKDLDPEETEKAAQMFAELMDSLNMSEVEVNTDSIRNTIFGIFPKGNRTFIEEAHEQTKAIMDAFSEELQTEEGREILYRLSLNPDTATWSIEEWIERYEGSEVSVNLRVNAEEIEQLNYELAKVQDASSQIQDEMNLKEALGQVVTAEDYKTANAQQREAIRINEELIAQEREHQSLLGVAPDDTAYQEIEQRIWGYESAIRAANLAIIENNQAINDLPLKKLSNDMAKLEAEATSLQDEMNLKEALGEFLVHEDYQKLIDNSKKQVANIQKQNIELRNQQFGLDSTSNKYQEIQSQIQGNINLINQATLQQLEWNEAASHAHIGGARFETPEVERIGLADSSANEGDLFEQYRQWLKEAKEMYDAGETETDDFKERARIFSMAGMIDAENFIENYNALSKYFTEDNTGLRDFLQLLESKGFATVETFSDGTEQWAYHMDDLGAAADALGMPLNTMLSLFGALTDQGFINDFVTSEEQGIEHLTKLYSNLATAEAELATLEIEQPQNTSAIQKKIEEIDLLNSRIDVTKENLIALMTMSADDANVQIEAGKAAIQAMYKELTELDPDGENYAQIEKILLGQIEKIAQTYGLNVNDIINQLSTYEESNLDHGYAEQINELIETNPGFKEAIELLRQYNTTKLESINYGDGKYDEGIEEAERAVDLLCESLGLTSDEAVELIRLLREMNYLDDNQNLEIDEKVVNTVSSANEVAENNPVMIPMVMEEPEVQSIEETVQNLNPLVPTFTLPQPNIEEGSSPNTITVTADNSPAMETVDEVTEYIESQVPVLHIKGDNSAARASADAAKNYIEHLNPDINIGANYMHLTNSISEALRGPWSINVNANVGAGGTLGSGVAAGTTWVDYRHSIGAYANGTNQNWALPHNETALVNELGNESLIRNGKWSLIPGSAHLENLQKGDIIFSADQTEQLIKYGKIISGNKHGKQAYADGTARNVVNLTSAYAIPYRGDGGATKKWTTSSSSPSSSSSSNASNNTKKAGEEASSALDKVLESLSKLMDWIEVRLERLQQKIDSYETKSELATGYKKKNEYVTKSQNTTEKLIEANQKGATRYEKKANEVAKKVGLSSKLKKKVQNGTIDIQSLSEDNKKRVEEYQKWYNKVVQCKQAVDELKLSLRDMAQTKLDNIENRFSGIVAVIEDSSNLINSFMEQSELEGYAGSSVYYEELINNEESKQKKLQKSIEAMKASLDESMLDGIIKKGSEEWYAARNQINAVRQELADSNTQVLEMQKNIRELEWEKFDKGQEAISRLTEESSFVIDLLSDEDLFDDKGRMTDAGMTTSGLHAMNYNTQMAQANQYGKELAEINAQLANDPTNVNLLERRKELINLQRESIKNAQDEKDAIVDLTKQGIEKQLSSLKDLIDKYNEAIDSQKNLQDYQDDVADQAKDLLTLRKQLAAYENDDSEAGRRKRQELTAKIEEQEKNLENTERDRAISDQKELLNEMYEQYEEILNERLEDTDALLQKAVDDANANSKLINDTITSQTAAVGVTISDAMTGIWGEGGTILTTSISGGVTSLNTTLGSILGFVEKIYGSADENAKKDISDIDTSGSVPEADVKVADEKPASTLGSKGVNALQDAVDVDKTAKILSILNSGSTDKKKIKEGLKDDSKHSLWKYIAKNYKHIPTQNTYKNLAKELGIGIKGDKATKKEKNKILEALKKKGYAGGVYNLPREEYAWTQENGQELVRQSDGAVWTRLGQGSTVFTKEQTKLLYDLSKNPGNFLNGSTISIPAGAVTNSTNGNTFQIEINVPNVTDYKEFISEMQKDNKFKNMIQDVTLGAINGKGNLYSRRNKF